jgi:hypothetical protein
MRGVVALLATCLLLASCSAEPEVTGSTNSCAMKLYTPFNPKNLNQCVDVCIRCDRGVTATCSTSCTLKGAH